MFTILRLSSYVLYIFCCKEQAMNVKIIALTVTTCIYRLSTLNSGHDRRFYLQTISLGFPPKLWYFGKTCCIFLVIWASCGTGGVPVVDTYLRWMKSSTLQDVESHHSMYNIFLNSEIHIEIHLNIEIYQYEQR